MKKLAILLLSVFAFVSIFSCRPSYMRCPKNRRCVDTNKTSKKEFSTTKKNRQLTKAVNTES